MYIILLSMGTYAQENLAGRVYQCDNLMEIEIKEVKKDLAKEAKTQEE